MKNVSFSYSWISPGQKLIVIFIFGRSLIVLIILDSVENVLLPP